MKSMSSASAATSFMRARRSPRPAVTLATTSVTLKGRPSASRSEITWVTVTPVPSWMRSMRSRRSQPEDEEGSVEMMTSSGLYSSIASSVAVYGSSSPSSPLATTSSPRR